MPTLKYIPAFPDQLDVGNEYLVLFSNGVLDLDRLEL